MTSGHLSSLRGESVDALPPGHGVYLCCVTPPEEGVDGCSNCGNHESYRFIPDEPEAREA